MRGSEEEMTASRLEHIGEILASCFEAIDTGESPAYSDLFFDSPCDSPIEDICAGHCLKHLRSNSSVDRQVEVDTQHGRFRIDFVLTAGEKKIAVECDGRDFHNSYRDEFRDAILLGEGRFDTIYHFRGCDLTYYPDDCIWLMSVFNPEFFTERGLYILERLHRLDIIRHDRSSDREDFQLRPASSLEIGMFWAFRRTIHTDPKHRIHWKYLYKFACEHPGASLDELIELHLGFPLHKSKEKEGI